MLRKWFFSVLALLVVQTLAVFTLDGSAIYTLSVGAAFVLTATSFMWLPRQAHRLLLVDVIIFAGYVGARFDALPVKVISLTIFVVSIFRIIMIARKIELTSVKVSNRSTAA